MRLKDQNYWLKRISISFEQIDLIESDLIVAISNLDVDQMTENAKFCVKGLAEFRERLTELRKEYQSDLIEIETACGKGE